MSVVFGVVDGQRFKLEVVIVAFDNEDRAVGNFEGHCAFGECRFDGGVVDLDRFNIAFVAGFDCNVVSDNGCFDLERVTFGENDGLCAVFGSDIFVVEGHANDLETYLRNDCYRTRICIFVAE